MAHPIHCEIRSSDADATRQFLGELFGWKFNEVEGGFPGYTFVDTGDDAPVYTAISPLQGPGDQVLFFIGVADVAAALSQAEKLGGRTVQPATQAPGVTFGVFADPQGHEIGVAANG
jgi:predicted enzyme related to lactoylglutathione lyase